MSIARISIAKNTAANTNPRRPSMDRHVSRFARTVATSLVSIAAMVWLPTPASAQTTYFTGTGSTGQWMTNRWSTTDGGSYNGAFGNAGVASFTSGSYTFTGFGTGTTGNITLANNVIVNFSGGAGTLATGGAVRTISVGSNAWIDFGSTQSFSTAAGTGFIKNGSGMLALSGIAYTGGFTLNAGEVILRGVNAMGAGGALTLNGGIVSSNATRSLTGKYSGGITVGGNVQFGNTPSAANNNLASASANLTFDNAMALGAANRTLTLGNLGTTTFGGVISNTSGGITFAAASGAEATVASNGRFEITGTANTFTGDLTFTGAEVRFANDGSLGNSANNIVINGGRFGIFSGTSFTVASSRSITVGDAAGTSISTAGSGTLTYNGVIANISGTTGSWAKQGGGTLALGGQSTYTGSTNISNGVLRLTTGSNRLPTTTVVSLGQAASTNVGTLDLNGQNQEIAGLASVTGSSATSSTNTVTSAGAATLTINVGSGTYTYSDATAANSGVISGALSVVKQGAGKQIFGGANTYTGTTAVTAGLLQINGAQTGNGAVTVTGGELKVNGSLGTSTVTLSGGLLSGSGTVGAVTVNSGATIAPGNSPGTLNTGNVTFAGGGNYNWQLFDATGSAGTAWDLISSSGSLSITADSGNKFNVNLWTLSGISPDTNGNASNFNQTSNYSWTVARFGSTITGFSNDLFNIVTGSSNGTGGFANSFGGTFSLAVVSGTNLNLVYTAPALAAYDYTGATGNWSTSSNWATNVVPTGTAALTFSGAGGTSTNDSTLSALTGLTFTGSATGAYTVAGSGVALGAAGVVNSGTFANTVSLPLTLAAASKLDAAAGSLAVTGTLDTAGYALTLQGANAISIAAVSGTGSLLKIGGGTATLAGAVASPNVSVSGGSLTLGAANRLADTAAVTASGSGTLDLGGFTDTVGSFTISSNATLANGTLTAGTYSLGGGTISGNLGAGTVNVTAATTVNGSLAAGTVNVNSGTLALGSAGRLTATPVVSGSAGGVLSLGGNETAGSIAGSFGVTTNGGTLTAGGDNSSTTFAGVISGSGGLSKAGSGVLIVSSSQTYTGDTTVSAGTLQIGSGAAAGGLAGNVVNNATLAFSSSVAQSLAGSISGNGSVTKSGTGTLALAGANTFSGGLTINDGVVSVAAAANLSTSGSIAVNGGGRLTFAGSDTFGGAGQSLVLSATQSATPIVSVASGVAATFLGNVALASGTNRIEPVNAAGSLTLSGNVTGSGSLLKAAAGNLILSGTGNAGTWGTQVGNGTLTVNAGSALGSGDLVMNQTSTNNATLALNESVSVGNLSSQYSGTGNNSITIAAGKTLAVTQTVSGTFGAGGPSGKTSSIGGDGGFTKAGNATLTLAGGNTYAGPTSVSAGTLATTAANAVSGNVTVASNATLALGAAQTFTSLSGNGTLAAGSSAMTFNTASDSTFGGNVTGSGSASLTKSGNATMNFTGDTSGYAGSVTVLAGKLTGIGIGSSGTVSVQGGGFYAAPGSTVQNAFTIGTADSQTVIYSQNFNSIGSGLPTGWAVYTAATGSSVGTAASFTTAATAWSTSTGGFYNYASTAGLTSASNSTDQSNSTNRAPGMKQTGSFGDPGAAFNYAFSTTGTTVSSISFDMLQLDSQPRSTTWSIQYGIGASPTSFTELGTYTDPGSWGSTTLTFGTAAFGTSLNNQPNVVFRVAAIAGSIGSNNRDATAIDNFQLFSSSGASGSGTLGIDTAGATTFSGNIVNNNVATLTAVAGGTATFSGIISGAGSFTKTGDGTVIISGSNSYGGGTTVSAGTLQAGNAYAFGTGAIVLSNGATLNLSNLLVGNSITNNGGTLLNAVISGSSTATTSSGSSSFNDVSGNVVATGSSTTVTLGGTVSGSISATAGSTATVTGNLASGGSVTVGAGSTLNAVNGSSFAAGSTVANNGSFAVNTSGGTIGIASTLSGTGGLQVAGGGIVQITGTSAGFTGLTTVSNTGSQLVVNGVVGSNIAIGSGALLGGSGSVGALSGAGQVGPGNSPGILTATSFDGTGGLDATFEITALNPVYNLPSASLNDVLRLTSGTPFTSNLNSGNVIDVYFDSVAQGTYEAGFFTIISASELLTKVQGATWNFWGKDANGTQNFGGNTYKNVLSFAGITGVNVTTVASTANFGSGNVTGSVTQFVVVPEPSSLALAGLGVAFAGYAAWKRRRAG
ncbi:MAG: autotransporter-associated beta strand repeat-containing protein [Planctomycetia bacterium]